MVAIHDEALRCSYRQNFHAVEAGGPATALAAALRYLDAYHQHDHLVKVQSEVRGPQGEQAKDAVLLPEARLPVSGDQSIPAPMEYPLTSTGWRNQEPGVRNQGQRSGVGEEATDPCPWTPDP
jgi:hypothetical protein